MNVENMKISEKKRVHTSVVNLLVTRQIKLKLKESLHWFAPVT